MVPTVGQLTKVQTLVWLTAVPVLIDHHTNTGLTDNSANTGLADKKIFHSSVLIMEYWPLPLPCLFACCGQTGYSQSWKHTCLTHTRIQLAKTKQDSMLYVHSTNIVQCNWFAFLLSSGWHHHRSSKQTKKQKEKIPKPKTTIKQELP